MSLGTLYTTPQQATGKIIKAAAALGNFAFDAPQGYVHFETNKTEAFLSKFPHGKIPAFESKDGGFKLFEGYAIARYVASQASNANLLGQTPEDAALVDQWSHLADSELDPPTSLIGQLCRGVIPYSKPVHTALLERIHRALGTFNKHLTTNTFLVGERLTLADLVLAGLVQRGVATTIDAEVRAKYPAVIRHLETITNQPKLKEIYGETNYTEKGIVFTPPQKEKKEAAPKPAAAPKAEKKPKAKEDDDDDDEPAAPAEPKVKNPLDDLPKSSFNLEDWKRAYSNKDTRGADGSIEWFYQNFDKDGFSLWRVDFKYNEELTQTFMSSNQIVGFFNRLEASRKYLFGSMGVLGKANDSIITGVLIARGSDIVPVVNVAPDYESYEYKKLSLDDAADKEFLEGALAWDLKVGDKEWADGKNFK
ncbi:elongation factor 1-gamma [Moniliophthora roreri MCA 2997]|uniref:Elongation factor 1-gamma n=2 Tax=Moniliophthora roreri TaxID=221103 RepID=V2WRK5_MONRO|nr:elongation factor 1-gamma [Moniliophthora roreri MCA 2997]